MISTCITKKHISSYRNKRIGVDGHVWLHFAASLVAHDLYRNAHTDKHVGIFMSKVKSLADHGITPVIVFDGDALASKEKTNRERKALRERYRAEVEFYIAQNNMARAKELMKRCISITPSILHSALRALRAHGVEYIISPYEADAQLCFLQKIGYIDCILTVDSDLVVYGATRVLYRFCDGHVEEYDAALLPGCRGAFFSDNLLDICILSGCDYVGSIRGIGLSTAHKKLREHRDVRSLVDAMRAARKEVPASYLEDFARARLTFLHHIVYNPITCRRQHLSGKEAAYEFLGTLEDVPYRVPSSLGEDLRIGRHHLPAARDIVQTAIEERIEKAVSVGDSSLRSPYFE